MTVETAPATFEHPPTPGPARPAGPRHRERPAPRMPRLPPTTRQRAAVVLAVAVALGGLGTGVATAAAPKHLGTATQDEAPKHLALAPKHLSGPSTAAPADAVHRPVGIR